MTATSAGLSSATPSSACPYDPALASPRPADAKANKAILAGMQSILDTTWDDYGHAARSVHAKSHAIVEGEMQILPGLPPGLAQGAFATPGTHPVILRFSTNPGDILDDTVSSPRGVALKIIGVQGERIRGSEASTTQDIIMVNGPAFVAKDAAAFAGSLGLLAATTDTGQLWKKAVSALLRTLVKAGSAIGLQGGSLKALGGQPTTHPLGETFYSQTPFRYGDAVAKFSLSPVTPALRDLTDKPVDLAGRPNGLRQALNEHFAHTQSEWLLRVQLRTNPDTMPVEDASVPWPEDESAYIPVARVVVRPQPGWNEARARQVDDGLAFTPWNGLAAHLPLGSINRARKDAYTLSSGFRAARNRCPIHEPTAKLGLSYDPAATFGTTPGREGRRPHTPDARPGTLTQPLNRKARAIAAGALGGLVAGAVTSGALLALEAQTGSQPELVTLKRRANRRLGRPDRRDSAPVPAEEEILAHTGHLALSVAAGAIYGATRPATLNPALAGTAFGAAFYALAYGLVGPAAGITPPLQHDTRQSIARHFAVHLMFGLTTALVAQKAAKRL